MDHYFSRHGHGRLPTLLGACWGMQLLNPVLTTVSFTVSRIDAHDFESCSLLNVVLARPLGRPEIPPSSVHGLAQHQYNPFACSDAVVTIAWVHLCRWTMRLSANILRMLSDTYCAGISCIRVQEPERMNAGYLILPISR